MLVGGGQTLSKPRSGFRPGAGFLFSTMIFPPDIGFDLWLYITGMIASAVLLAVILWRHAGR